MEEELMIMDKLKELERDLDKNLIESSTTEGNYYLILIPFTSHNHVISCHTKYDACWTLAKLFKLWY